jgi:hypothetical protein
MRKYSLVANGIDQPVKVEIDVPSNWKEDASNPRAPEFTIPGLDDSMISLVALRVDADNADEALRKAIALQYGADAKDVKREELAGGRVWMVRKENSYDHARVFAPFPGGVAMAFAMNEDPSGKSLAQVKAAFATFKVVR